MKTFIEPAKFIRRLPEEISILPWKEDEDSLPSKLDIVKWFIIGFIILVLAWLPTQAKSEEIARAPNTGEGYIVLTSIQCKTDLNKFIVYTYNKKGTANFGCWSLINSEIFVKWNEGDVSIYPINEFQFTEKFLNNIQKPKTKI